MSMSFMYSLFSLPMLPSTWTNL
uniref:Uncharacterized protein n=1 Tax=Arundo donax TaxID=35708 RepID=A0A0A8ZVX5_ARUDO